MFCKYLRSAGEKKLELVVLVLIKYSASHWIYVTHMTPLCSLKMVEYCRVLYLLTSFSLMLDTCVPDWSVRSCLDNVVFQTGV